MEKTETQIPGVWRLTPKRFGDDRGWFSEVWNQETCKNLGLNVGFVQDNHSMSELPGTLRGLHFQAPPHAQDKLVRCTHGAIFDVAVDIRRGSPSYGKWIGVDLTAQGGEQLFIPKGVLHGFLTRTPKCEVQYKCSDVYAPQCDGTVAWDSAGIDWPLTGRPILSAKDADAPALAALSSPFIYGETT